MTGRARVEVTTQEGYRLWADHYDDYPNPLIAVEAPIVEQLLGDVAGKTVLDAACGTGRHSLRLAERGAKVVGVDASEAMMAVARAKRPTLQLSRGELEALPFADGAFDLVLNALALEHLPRVDRAIAELSRVTRTGGRVVVSVFHPFFLLKGVPPHFDHPDGHEYVLPGHVHLVSSYVHAVRAAGLELDELLEPLVDAALAERYPNMTKHLGLPVAVIFSARKT